MNMLQIHADALSRLSTTYHELLLHYSAHDDIVYGIVEGKEDPMFYRGVIEGYLPEGWEVKLIPAGHKDNVLKTIAMFDWTRFSSKRICFFADRDLSDFIPKPSVTAENLYITDNYSIENNVVNFGVLKRLLEEVFNITGLKPTEIKVIEQRFTSALELFQEAMLSIMVQVVLWRRNGKRPCLNDIRPKDFFIFANGDISLSSRFETVLSRVQHAAKCVDLYPSDQTEFSLAEKEFRQGQGAERFIRGKYVLWFLIEFAKEIHHSLPFIFTKFTSSPKKRISIGVANAMVILAPRIKCPTSLRDFLEYTYGQFIRERQDQFNKCTTENHVKLYAKTEENTEVT